jgi:sugar/nucleoside kinase (ribokinase family)
MRLLRIDESSPYQQLFGVGGLGSGIFFALEGNQTLGRNESRLGELLDVRDYCKLHIVIHYIAKLLGNQCFRVFPVGKIGLDAAGQSVLKEMNSVGIDTRFVKTVSDKPTMFSVCFQYPDGTGGNITTSNSAAADLRPGDLAEIASTLSAAGRSSIALLLPEVSLDVRGELLGMATRAGAFRAASFVAAEIAAAKESGMFEQLDLVALNEGEASELIGDEFSPDNPQACMAKCVRFLDLKYPRLQMVISLGKSGAYGLDRNGWNFCPAPEVAVASTAGAGDCLLGGILATMAAGLPLLNALPPRASLRERPLVTALEFGVLLASYKVTSLHTIHPDASLSSLIGFAKQIGAEFGPEMQKIFGDLPVPQRVT